MPDAPGPDAASAGSAFPAGAAGAADKPLHTEAMATGEPGAGSAGPQDRPRSLWTDAWHDLRRKPIFLISSFMIGALVLVAVAPGLFTDTDPRFCDLSRSNQGPQSGAPFGYTKQGCDIYSRVLYGARPSISVGILVTLGAMLVGGTIGAIAGFYGRAADAVLSRITDVFLAIPLLLGGIVFLSAFPNRSLFTVVLALVFLGWPQLARIMRGAVIAVKESDFVVAARALGASNSRILLRHILPNALAPVIVIATINLGIYIVVEATLSFLGIGLPPSTVSWGNDISEGQVSLRSAPHVIMFPAAALSITVLSFIMLGDAVRDALDPRLR